MGGKIIAMEHGLSYVKFVLLNLALILTLSCSFGVKPIYHSEQRRIASNEVERFHSLLSDEEHEGLYKMTSPRARSHKKKEDFVAMT